MIGVGSTGVVTAFIPPPRQADELVAIPAQAGSGRGRAEYLEHPPIDELLSRAAGGRICAVIGAAGWGKTTAVASWSQGRRTGWLGFGAQDDTAEHVLGRLAEVMRAHVPQPAPAGDVTAMCGWMRELLPGDFVLVLDDLHELRPGSGAARAVERLCQHAPDRLRLVLISRCELPFSLQRLRGHGVVSELYAHDLAFNVIDIDSLLRKTVGPEPPGLARRVWEHTGGWPAAVHSAIEMLRGVSADQRLAVAERLAQPGERFHDYLAEEVIGPAPEETRALLRRLAFLGEASSMTELTGGMSGTATPGAGLVELARQGLVRRGRSAGTWSLVPVLRDYFEHTARPDAHERTLVRLRAAEDCLTRGASADALRHLLAAGDHAACTKLLIDHGEAMVERGQLDAVLAAAHLPAEYLGDPRIHHILGLAHQLRGQWAPALAHFQHAGHDRADVAPALAWRLGGIAFARGELAELDAVIRRTRLENQDTLDETRVLALAASAHWFSGDLGGLGKAALETHAAAQRCGDPLASSLAHQVFALLATAEGDGREAGIHLSAAVRDAELSESVLQLAWIKTCQALHQFDTGAP
ncbi:MAG TPA: hypothetical protein VFO16_08270, partial [Pseudonocardiaceae bacterium]|nr:hypothetical protein [Pseudonocardiaceae bacterium]